MSELIYILYIAAAFVLEDQDHLTNPWIHTRWDVWLSCTRPLCAQKKLTSLQTIELIDWPTILRHAQFCVAFLVEASYLRHPWIDEPQNIFTKGSRCKRHSYGSFGTALYQHSPLWEIAEACIGTYKFCTKRQSDKEGREKRFGGWFDSAEACLASRLPDPSNSGTVLSVTHR